MMPTPAACAACGCANETSWPSIRIVPASGGYTPARIFIRVDLPAPFSPTTAWISPACRSRSTPCSTSTPTKLFVMPRISSSGSDIDPLPCGGGGEHRVGDGGSADAVGEPREPVRVVARDRGVGVGHEGVEALEVALRMADRDHGVARRGGTQPGGVAPQLLGALAPAHPQGLRALLLEAHARELAGDLDVEVVLAARGHLADEQRADDALGGAEQHCGQVLGADPAAPVTAVGVRFERSRGVAGGAPGHPRGRLPAHRRDPGPG